MPNSGPITINGYSLDSSASVMATATTHDSAPKTDLSIVPISRRDGAKIINAQYSSKQITIIGYLLLGLQRDFDQVADDFKRNVEVQNGTLQIPYVSGTRQYNVYTSAVTISRDYDNIDYAPYQIDFLAADPPFGTDIVTKRIYSASNITGSTWSSSVYFTGSAEPKPRITIGVDSGSYLTSLQLNTFSPPTTFIFSDSQFTTNDQYSFDTGQYALTKNGLPLDYSGQWPRFTPNQWNGVGLTFTGTVGNQIDQQQLTSNGGIQSGGLQSAHAQGFTPAITGSRLQVDLALAVAGWFGETTNTQDITVQLRDSTPTNTPGSNILGTGTISVGTLTTNLAIVSAVFSPQPSLKSGSLYHYVIFGSPETFLYAGVNSNQYAGGQFMLGSPATAPTTWGSPINLDLFFRDWMVNGNPAHKISIAFDHQARWL